VQAYQYAAASRPGDFGAMKNVCVTYLALNDAEGVADAAWAMISARATDSKMPLQAVLLGEEIAKAGHPEIAWEIYHYLVENHAGNQDTAWAQKNICNMYMDAGLAAAVETLATKFEKARTVTEALTKIGDKYCGAGLVHGGRRGKGAMFICLVRKCLLWVGGGI